MSFKQAAIDSLFVSFFNTIFSFMFVCISIFSAIFKKNIFVFIAVSIDTILKRKKKR